MSLFTNNELLELEEYVTNELLNMQHIDINELTFLNNMISVQFNTAPIRINYIGYKVFIWGRRDLYYIKYEEYHYKIFGSKPIILNEKLYEIEYIDDVFNILEDIFDTLRPRDEY